MAESPEPSTAPLSTEAVGARGRRTMWVLVAVAATAAAAVGALAATGTLGGAPGGDGDRDGDPGEPQMLAHADAYDSADGSLRSYWRTPIHPQGDPPATWTPIEQSLRPTMCGQCHQAQFTLWKGSRHAKAVSPGIHAQILEKKRSDRPIDVRACSACHFPLWEQHEIIANDGTTNPDYDEELYGHGVSCAVCHVRNHRRHGPERRTPEVLQPPHGGFERKSFFSESRFCARCHQFRPGGLALNGTLLENTYEEWKASAWADKGTPCQGCHMPDRKHLFRGIHDPETTRQAVTITVEPDQPAAADERLTVHVANTGAGHHFPTYVTPAVYVRFHLVNDGAKVEGSEAEHRIQRRVPTNLSEEIEDTRIPAGERASFEYTWEAGAGDAVVVTVVADPDEFYRRFYESRLKKDRDDDVRAAYEAALAETNENVFTIWEREIPLPLP